MFHSKRLPVIIFVSISATIIASAIGQQQIAIAYSKPDVEKMAEATASNKQSSTQQLGNTVATVSVGEAPIGIAVNPNTNMIYVVNQISNTASVIDGKTNAVIKNIQTGMNPAGIAVNPNTNKIYLVTRSEDEFEEFGVSIMDGKTNGVVKSITVGKGPISIAVNPNTNMIYQVNPGADTVSMIMAKFPSVR